MDEDDLNKDSRVCSRHFPAGDVSKGPQINLGKRFSSPIKKKLPRAKRAKCRDHLKEVSASNISAISESPVDELDVQSSTAEVESTEVQSLTTIL